MSTLSQKRSQDYVDDEERSEENKTSEDVGNLDVLGMKCVAAICSRFFGQNHA